MGLGTGGQWCEVELDLFDPADFVEHHDRLFHVRNVPGGRDAHCADGYLTDNRYWSGVRRSGASARPAGSAGVWPGLSRAFLSEGGAALPEEVRKKIDAAVGSLTKAPPKETRTGTDEAVLLRKAAFDAELDRDKTIHDARVELVKGSLDRARSDAEFVRNAAGGILAIYEAVLGLGFVAKDAPIHLSAVLGTMFLAFALASASAYIAWIGRAQGVDAPIPSVSLREYQARRLNAFTDWVVSAVDQRAAWLHFAVICLFLGAVALPLPFLTIKNLDQNDPVVFGTLAAVGLAVALVVANSPWQWRPSRSKETHRNHPHNGSRPKDGNQPPEHAWGGLDAEVEEREV